MKILIPGKKLTEKWIGKCSKCGAVIEAETNELIVEKGDYRSDYEDYAWEACPSCAYSPWAICFHKEGTKSANRDLGTNALPTNDSRW